MSHVFRVRRRAFALLAILWIITGVASLGLVMNLAARESIGAARNRTDVLRAMWQANECAERARFAVAEAIQEREGPITREELAWRFLDSAVAASEYAAQHRCETDLTPLGLALDVNAVDGDMLGELLRATGVPSERADSMVAAMLDWRDSDDVARALGAEHSWYARAGRAPPRNAPLASEREIAFVRGFGAPRAYETLLTVETAPIILPRAPLPVIAALPGIGAEALARVAERRLQGPWPGDIASLAAELSLAARAEVLSHYAELARLTTSEPDAWIVTSRARAISSSVTAVIELRLVRSGSRAAIVRRRSWVE